MKEGDTESDLFSAVDVPRQHPIFHDGNNSEVTPLFGLPLLVRYPTIRSSLSNTSLPPLPTAYLNLNFDDKGNDLRGTIPDALKRNQPPAIVVRKDGKAFEPDVVAAACDFCRYRIQPLLVRGAAHASMGGLQLRGLCEGQ